MKKSILDDLLINKKPDISSDDSHQVSDAKPKSIINRENYEKNKVSILKQKSDRKKELKSSRIALNKELEILLEQISNKSLVQHRGVIKNKRFTFKYEMVPIKK